MPVHYNITTALNMIIFVCQGFVSGPELFEASDLAQSDQRFQYGMIILIDLLSAADNFELKDVRVAIQRMNNTAEQGHARADIVLLSMNTRIKFLVNTMHLMPNKVPLKIKICLTFDQAIDSLGLGESKAEIVQFWDESHRA